MRRRAIFALIGGAAICRPLAARRQARDRVLMIGWLNVLAEDAPEPRLRIEVFRQRTGSKGAPFACELVTLAPDVILTSGSVAKGRGRALVSGECLYLAALIESAGGPRLMRLVAS